MGHEAQPGDARDMALQHRRRGRPLQGEKRVVSERVQAQIRQLSAQKGEIGLFAGGVDDQEKPFAGGVGRELRHHQVVEDSALVIGELGVADAPRRERLNVAGNEAFEPTRGVRPGEKGLSHVGNVEQAGLPTSEKMFGEDALGVIDRQGIAGELDHPPAEGDMAAIKRRTGRGLLHIRHHASSGPRRAKRPVTAVSRNRP